MSLAPGARLGAYEVLSLLGSGGMGEVYKARDTRLNRVVAIKILSAQLAADPDRRARFDREAHAVAALNHPHICNLHDVGESAEPETAGAKHGTIRFLVMEFLEGQTLEERLVKGPLPPADLLRYGMELADALDHAHRKGLVHRDLKPGNVMLTKTGVKLLDFGISRLRATPGLVELATMTAGGPPLTAEGAILGTYPYMAPEQLAGREADARSDIFAFGAVLHEMATARRAFEGTTAATVIGAILHSAPPPLSTLQPLIPQGLDRLVSRCLAKDPEDRWQTARDLMLELKWIGEQTAPPSTAGSQGSERTKLAWIASAAAAVLAIAAGSFILGTASRPPADASVVRLPFTSPDGLTLATVGSGGPVTISPDGRQLVFVATGADGRRLLWVRALDSLDARPLPETDGGAFPFWSPDSRSVGFFAQGKLRKTQVAGGPPQTICDALQPQGGTWSRTDEMVFASGAGYEMYRVSAGGGVPTTLPADGLNQERSRPFFLPDGRHFLYHGRPQNPGVYVASLDALGATLLLKDYVAAVYVSGYLLGLTGTTSGSGSSTAGATTLLAQPFNPTRLELTGAPEAVASRIDYASLTNVGAFSAAETGTLVYGNVARRITHLMWFDRAGKPVGQVGSSGAFSEPVLSPNGQKVAVRRLDPETQDSDVWTIDLTRGMETAITTQGGLNFLPVWSPDGMQIAFVSARQSPPNVHLTTTTGGPETRLVQSSFVSHTTDWSGDGKFIVYATRHPKTGWDLMRVPISAAGTAGKPEAVQQTTFNEHFGRVSPDGRWLAYMSDESGKEEVYVATWPAVDAKWHISTNGGTEPSWSRDGNELFYLRADDTLMVARVLPGATFTYGALAELFKPRIAHVTPFPFTPNYAVSHDGQRFLINTVVEESNTAPTKIVFNWLAALRQRD